MKRNGKMNTPLSTIQRREVEHFAKRIRENREDQSIRETFRMMRGQAVSTVLEVVE